MREQYYGQERARCHYKHNQQTKNNLKRNRATGVYAKNGAVAKSLAQRLAQN